MKTCENYEFLTANEGDSGLVIGGFDGVFDGAADIPLPGPNIDTAIEQVRVPTVVLDAQERCLFIAGLTRQDRPAALRLTGLSEARVKSLQAFPRLFIYEMAANGAIERMSDPRVESVQAWAA